MHKTRLLGLVLLSFAAGMVPVLVGAQQGQGGGRPSAAAAPDANGGVCIASSIAPRLSQCPSATPAERTGTKAGPAAPSSHLQASKRRQEEKKQGPRGPGFEVDPAVARNREHLQARSEQLLRDEIRLTERLVHNTRQDDPHRPEVLLRLAETYFELQQALNAKVRGFDDPIFQACQADQNAPACRQQHAGQHDAETQLNESRESAIRSYAQLVQDHPNFRRMDEVLFSLGFALEEMHQFDRARQVYSKLIKGYSTSRYIPNAYLSFAEYYFTEGDMQAALQFYSKVTEIPADRNPVYGYAIYKMAWVQYNLDDFRAALQKFVETIEFANQNPEAPDVANLSRQARKELVLPYARVGSPDRALEFFRRYAKDEGQAVEMFENLGELYFDTGDWPKAIAVYHDLMGAQPASNKLCYWQSRVTNAIISSKPKAEQTREIQRMVDLFEAFTRQGNGHSPESVNACKQSTASILIEQATAWHREAVGTDTQPGTNDRATMNLASQLYKLVLDKFPDMESMEFPDIDRRDWPNTYRVSYFFAELLWKMEDWSLCGPAFDKVVELNPAGEFTSDAAYAAVLCYNNLYQQQYQAHERESRSSRAATPEARGGRGRGRAHQAEAAPTDPNAEYRPREFSEQETGMLNAFQRFVCFVPDSDELPQVKYRRARIFYESNHYEEAAVLFKDIAWNHRQSELAEYAANLYLDSLNVLGTHSEPARPSCFDTMESDVEQLRGFYCSTDQLKSAHAELCGVILKIRCEIKRKKAEALQANRSFLDAAHSYVNIYRECQDDPVAGAKMDEVLWNAAINYEAAYSIGRAIRVRKKLIEKFPESILAKRALFLLGESYRALALYGDAAGYYEQFATRYPTEDGHQCTDHDREANLCPIAHEALDQAVVLRIGLGESDKAIEDARLYERNYRTKFPRESAQVVFAIGVIYENRHDWSHVVDHYKTWLRNYGRTGLPHQVIRANVQIARAYLNANSVPQSAPFVRDAIAAWEHAAAQNIQNLPDTDDRTKAKYLLEAKTAASEALFLTAENLYQEYLKIRFPDFHGGNDLAAVNRWSQHDFAPWVQRKKAALEAAEAAYNKLTDESVRVPQWMIAGASRIGQMYTAFVDAFDDAPIPREIETDPELYEIYAGALNQQRDIFFHLAIPKFQFCLETSTQLRWFNDYSRTCESELNRLNPTEYPIAAEVRGSPDSIHRDFARPGAIELGSRNQEDEGDSQGGGQ